MLESLVSFYNELPGIIRWVVGFTFNVIILRGILANEILLELKQRGILKGGILPAVKKVVNNLGALERKVAIVSHYRHHDGEVLGCSTGRCAAI